MNTPESNTSEIAGNWDSYWHGTGGVGAYSSGGVSHPVIQTFWDEFFQAARQSHDKPKMIDIASGNGVVVEHALATYEDEHIDVTCLDVSEAAIANIKQRFPDITGVVSDARSIPLDSGGFDIATSQFGVEYAGLEAVDETARLLVAGGKLALLMHHQEGSIKQECVESLDAIHQLQESRFIPLAIDMFTAGFAAVQGANRDSYEAAATKLAPAITALEAIMTQYGLHVAGDTIGQLYDDVARIHQRIQHYEPDETLDWLKAMDSELGAYAGRMSSMTQSATGHKDFEKIVAGLRDMGYKIERADALVAAENELPLAWALIATR
jgi:ubiquinone/menaquinone biosynthesis C-methylase UbiE